LLIKTSFNLIFAIVLDNISEYESNYNEQFYYFYCPV
jgi:hypothetical protein